ncbi:MAG TPA: hypothetical protein VNR40_00970, partial [Steroidobacter sp.]|nr:hypothetical protein [Steroidobacter sp.]
TKEFVESERGQREIENAGNVSPSEAQDIQRAEQQAKQRAKDHDPEELRGDSGSESTRSEDTRSQDSSRNSRPAH